jgi:hypothetical protein
MPRPPISGRFVLPPLLIRVPAAFHEQAVGVGEPTVTADEEPKAFAVRLARPASIPRLTARVARIESDAP